VSRAEFALSAMTDAVVAALRAETVGYRDGGLVLREDLRRSVGGQSETTCGTLGTPQAPRLVFLQVGRQRQEPSVPTLSAQTAQTACGQSTVVSDAASTRPKTSTTTSLTSSE
jgi:hypothetical protein